MAERVTGETLAEIAVGKAGAVLVAADIAAELIAARKVIAAWQRWDATPDGSPEELAAAEPLYAADEAYRAEFPVTP